MKFWQVVSFSEPEQLVEIARAAEEAGFHGVLLADHIFFPGELRSRYPYSADGKPAFDGATPFPDPWTTIAAMSSVTTRLRFGTMVFILPLRHPLELAKTLGTLALLSGGRVVLGAGAGWVREEFDTLGIPFETRGKRMEEMVAVMRQVWTGRMVEHRGRFFEHGPLQMSPAPGHAIPIYFGGISDVALARAARLGQGWIGTGQMPEEAVELCRKLARLRAEAGREREPFETIVPLVVPPEPDLLRRLEAEGMTSTSAYPFTYTIGPTSTLAQKREQMLRFGETVIAKLA
jgi:probable F420-dependent oxidoreductase